MVRDGAVEYTFLLIFLSPVGAVAGFAFLWVPGALPQGARTSSRG